MSKNSTRSNSASNSPPTDTEARMPMAFLGTAGSPPLRRTIRRHELRRMVPVADTTIYEMERRGQFPRRFNITARCVVWDADEVEAWMEARRMASDTTQLPRAPYPDVRQRKHRPVKARPGS